MKIGIGIDTGGTYTDAVIYNFTDQAILGSAKALTTRQDLSIGISEALDGLPGELLQQADVIALSTTLATNACVENKGGSAKLIFIGGDARIIDSLGGKYGLPPAKDICIQESGITSSGERESEPDWALFGEQIKTGFDHLDGVGIVEMNAMRNGAAIEKKAKALFQAAYDIPVVCGHELFSELNSLQRGSSTLLNAGLFPVIREFLDAVKVALKKRGIEAALVIVRSDGSMMSEAFAAVRPVETLLCGPAASAMGGLKLCGEKNSVIVDMGGTTTDIALVRDGVPVTVMDGVSIGKWRTFVNGLYVKTLGLGGDSAVHFRDNRVVLEEYRIVPLCVAAHRHPGLVDSLKRIPVRMHSRPLYEHYMLVRDIDGNDRYTAEEQAFCAALKDGPLPVAEAAEAIGTDLYNLNMARLVKNGVVQLCGLTPTDIMHIRGDFTRYSAEASRLAAAFVAHNLDITIEALCEQVYDSVKRTLYLNIVKALLENEHPSYQKKGIGSEVERLIHQSYDDAKAGRGGIIRTMFHTDFTFIGIGAPIRVFLGDVAELMGTRVVIPTHYEVANALGAIAGNISASCTIEIYPIAGAGGITGYTVFGNDGNRSFEALEDAQAFATVEAEEGARREAVKRGARGELSVACGARQNEGAANNCTIYLGTTVTARAVGSIGF